MTESISPSVRPFTRRSLRPHVPFAGEGTVNQIGIVDRYHVFYGFRREASGATSLTKAPASETLSSEPRRKLDGPPARNALRWYRVDDRLTDRIPQSVKEALRRFLRKP